MTDQHTPLPWHTAGTATPTTDPRESLWGPIPPDAQSGEWIAKDIRPANVALILKAVNTHQQLVDAVTYVLDRIQDNPDVRYYCGYGTQIFYLLIRAEAAVTGRPLAEIEAERRRDLQPDYRRLEPEVIRLREQLHEARQ